MTTNPAVLQQICKSLDGEIAFYCGNRQHYVGLLEDSLTKSVSSGQITGKDHKYILQLQRASKALEGCRAEGSENIWLRIRKRRPICWPGRLL